MSELIKKPYTEEQKEVLETIYGYSDKANYSEDDIAIAKKMFDTPEKFALLRKILQVLSPDERGLSIPNVQTLVNADIKDLHAYAIETAVNNLADEKVRQTLNAFYRLLRTNIIDEKKTEFDEINQQSFEESKNTEEFSEQQKKDKEKFGENL